MAGNKQKLKLLYLIKIFTEDTDDQHALTLPQIAEKLDAYGVSAERKTLYQDFELLRDFGFDIIGQQARRNFYYHMGNRRFELPELKLLVDSVQSAKFITDKKSNTLIKKLEGMVSKYEARKLQRQVIISGRIKALRKDGAWYQVSPWALMWDDENYYLVGYDAEDGKIKHYRVDKMWRISVADRKREGKEQFRAFNMPRYTKSLFGMFGGEEVKVTLEAENGMVGILLDRFGKDIPVKPVDADHFRTSVVVAVSSQFLGWIMALGDGVKIIGPDKVVARMKEEIRLISQMYEN